MEHGFLAALNLIGNTYIARYHINTVSGIIRRFAPNNENDTEGYIQTVCRLTGLGGEEVISHANRGLRELVWAMAQVESGKGIVGYREALDAAWLAYRPVKQK